LPVEVCKVLCVKAYNEIMHPGETSARNKKWYHFQIRARKAFNKIPLREHQKISILTLLIGAICGLAAVSFHLLLDFFQDHIIYNAASTLHWWRIPLLIIIPSIGGLIAGAGLYFFAPEARGSGIPQVKTAFFLDGGRIPARVIPGKMLLASLNIGTGASLGREGPTVQICAAIASLLGRVFAISRRRLQSLVPVGAAAAVIEHALLGEHPLFSVPAYKLNNALQLVFYALLGLLAGIASVVFNVSIQVIHEVTD
jgi:chloride channel protein, CIC family